MIEKGRYENRPLCDRTCPFCPDQIENEFHFLIKCPIYTELRARMLEDIEDIIYGFYYPEDENFLFWFLLKKPIDSGYHWQFHKAVYGTESISAGKPTE